MQHLDLSTAEDKILADIRRYVAEVEGIVRSPIETVGHGVRMLVALRKTSYEDLNQIQHEYAALCAIQWLSAQNCVSEGVNWQWNPRQTGNAAEPDIRAVLEGKTIISGEVTTSSEPKGFIDSRMASTLRKLATMEGQQFYFVLTSSMANRARTKVAKAGYVCASFFQILLFFEFLPFHNDIIGFNALSASRLCVRTCYRDNRTVYVIVRLQYGRSIPSRNR